METLTQTSTKISTRTKVIITAVALAAIGGIAAGVIPAYTKKLPNLSYLSQSAVMAPDGSVNITFSFVNNGEANVDGSFDVQFTYLKPDPNRVSANQSGLLNNYVIRVRAQNEEVIRPGAERTITGTIPADMIKRSGTSPWFAYMDINNRIKESNETDNIMNFMIPAPIVYPIISLTVEPVLNILTTGKIRNNPRTPILSFSIAVKNNNAILDSLGVILDPCVSDIKVFGITNTQYGSIADDQPGYITSIPMNNFKLIKDTKPTFKVTANTTKCVGKTIISTFQSPAIRYPYGIDLIMNKVINSSLTITK